MDDIGDLKQYFSTILMGSVFEPYASDYISKLIEGRYAATTGRLYANCIRHFVGWLTVERLGEEGLKEEVGRRFITEHLPRCDCPPPVRRSLVDIKAALSHLYDVVRTRRMVGVLPGPVDHVRCEIAAFDHYMDVVCGLAAKTRRQRILFLTRFLTTRFGSEPIVATTITANDLRQFVLGAQSSHGTGLIRVMAEALRCYLRFRTLAGDAVELLIGSLPRPSHRRLKELPVVLSKAEVKQLLGSFDETLPSMRRAYAMVRCLADLGLRMSEVVNLHLDDIDWHEGIIRLSKCKSRRTDVLPLPADTGRAIAEYLQMERPLTTNRAVFVRHVAPYDKPVGVGVVLLAVQAAYRRCGWAHTRPHILRHSVASQLLQEGTPLKEIADVLRHRSLNTSMTYVRVDTARLSAVALPWPGRTS